MDYGIDDELLVLYSRPIFLEFGQRVPKGELFLIAYKNHYTSKRIIIRLIFYHLHNRAYLDNECC